MAQKFVLLIVGLAVGVGIGYLVAGSNRPETVPDKDAAALDTRIADLERVSGAKDVKILDLESSVESLKNAVAGAESKSLQLEETIAEMKSEAAVPEVEVEKPGKKEAGYADLEEALGQLGAGFQSHILGTDKELAKEIQDLFAAASPEDVQKMIDTFREADDLGKKTVMAHFLGMSHHPEALKALEEIVRNRESNLMDRRVASHGLAFSGNEEAKPLLLEMAKHDPDRGTRANSAFGLDRMGDPQGVPLYFKAMDEAFAEKDPVAVQYLGGISLMGDRALPAARERLTKYSDWQAKIALIHYIQSRKDKDSVNVLSALARDETQTAAVRKAAEGAIKTIEGE